MLAQNQYHGINTEALYSAVPQQATTGYNCLAQ